MGRGLHGASLPSPAVPGVLRAPGEGEPATLTCLLHKQAFSRSLIRLSVTTSTALSG